MPAERSAKVTNAELACQASPRLGSDLGFFFVFLCESSVSFAVNEDQESI